MIINKNNKDTSSHLRFRRWSRKPYAVFIGLKKNISIGTLAKGVLDRLLPKTNPLVIIVLNGAHLSLQSKSMDEVLSHESEIQIPLATTSVATS